MLEIPFPSETPDSLEGLRLTIHHLHKREQTHIPLAELLQVVRGKRNARKITLLWSQKRQPSKYVFLAHEQRERFYEIANFFLTRHNDLREEEISVFIGTWNMGEAPPPPNTADLSQWIKKDYDVYAIGTQECVYDPDKQEEGDRDVSANEGCEADWFRRIDSCLGEDYVKVCGLSLKFMRLIVLVHQKHRFKVKTKKMKEEDENEERR